MNKMSITILRMIMMMQTSPYRMLVATCPADGAPTDEVFVKVVYAKFFPYPPKLVCLTYPVLTSAFLLATFDSTPI